MIISHFHGDHINGLVGPDNKPAFPNAEVMVPAVEWAFWADESNTSKLPEIARGQMGNVKRVFGVLDNKVTRYDFGQGAGAGHHVGCELRPHAGHNSHVIASGNRPSPRSGRHHGGRGEPLFTRNPEWEFVFDTDKALAVQTRKKLYDMAAADKMLVQGYHFPFPSIGYIEKAGSGYRMIPAAWNPNI